MTIPPLPIGLEQALHDHVFSTWDASFLRSPAGHRAMQDVLVTRFRNALTFAVPWLQRCVPLTQARLIEIGCGSGSSTAALAMHAREVVGFDIDAAACKAARARCAAYGLQNATVVETAPERLLEEVVAAGRADVYMLYAVLEHQTWQERIETLRTLWDQLMPGGFLVIIETPNRLTYLDPHTSELEFFHLLPDELAFRYLDRVPRAAFRETLRRTLTDDPSQAPLQRVRWGLGASYHEVELGLGERLDEVVVADGFEQEMRDFFPGNIDEELLTQFFLARIERQPIGFARAVLNLVLKKPMGDRDRDEAVRFSRRRREALTKAKGSAPKGALSFARAAFACALRGQL